jgi:hypothetical protein
MMSTKERKNPKSIGLASYVFEIGKRPSGWESKAGGKEGDLPYARRRCIDFEEASCYTVACFNC